MKNAAASQAAEIRADRRSVREKFRNSLPPTRDANCFKQLKKRPSRHALHEYGWIIFVTVFHDNLEKTSVCNHSRHSEDRSQDIVRRKEGFIIVEEFTRRPGGVVLPPPYHHRQPGRNERREIR